MSRGLGDVYKRQIYTFSLYIPLAMFVGLFILISKFDLETRYGDMMKAIAERNEKEKAAQ